MPVEKWFPTPIYYGYVKNLEAVQQELIDCSNRCNFSKVPGWNTNTHSLSTTTFTDNIIAEQQLIQFEKELYKHVKEFVHPTYFKNGYKIYSSWLTLTKTGEYAHKHSHVNFATDLCGCYYVKSNGEDGNIRFHNHNFTAYDPLMQLGSHVVEYKPEVGKILLFPPWLEHEVLENTTDEERISLSFNIYFNRL